MLAAIAATALVAVAPGAGAATKSLRVRAISTKPQYVTGGNVLVRVRPASGTPKFTVAGKPANARSLGTGDWLVSGLPDGPSRIGVTSGSAKASLAVVDHPTTGPIFSGPHLPLLCTAPTVAASASEDATCAAPPTVDMRGSNYVSSSRSRVNPMGRLRPAASQRGIGRKRLSKAYERAHDVDAHFYRARATQNGRRHDRAVLRKH